MEFPYVPDDCVAIIKSCCQALKFRKVGEICMRKAALPSAVIFVERHEIASPKGNKVPKGWLVQVHHLPPESCCGLPNHGER